MKIEIFDFNDTDKYAKRPYTELVIKSIPKPSYKKLYSSELGSIVSNHEPINIYDEDDFLLPYQYYVKFYSVTLKSYFHRNICKNEPLETRNDRGYIGRFIITSEENINSKVWNDLDIVSILLEIFPEPDTLRKIVNSYSAAMRHSYDKGVEDTKISILNNIKQTLGV
jgi:hypothetical protein